MSARPAHSIQRSHFAEPIKADDLVRRTCSELSTAGVLISPTKVHRLVHRWLEKVRWTGYGFDQWMADSLTLHGEQRARLAWGLRNAFGVMDPTGQRGARNADRDLRLGGAWHE